MQRTPIIVSALLVLALGTAGLAETKVIDKYTVIPVVLDDGLSSAKNKAGDKFESHCTTNCGGFPGPTTFIGVVTGAYPRTADSPGALEVKFVQAYLPDNRAVDIYGTLTPLSEEHVATDPVTGNLVGTKKSKNQVGTFAAIGAGAGLIFGGDVKGLLKGGVAGAVIGALVKPKTKTEDVTVPIGTEFGIMLRDPVVLSDEPEPAAPTVVRAGEGEIRLVFADRAPYMDRGVLMVPSRPVLEALDRPFTFDAATKVLTVSSDIGPIDHPSLTDNVTIRGTTLHMDVPSKLVHGVLFVPKELVELVSMKRLTWYASTSTLVCR